MSSSYLLLIAVNSGTIDVSVPRLHEQKTITYSRSSRGNKGSPKNTLNQEKVMQRDKGGNFSLDNEALGEKDGSECARVP